MSTALRRLVLLGVTMIFVWPLVEVLMHRSDQGIIFGRYSPSYFGWVVFYVLAFALWCGAAYAAIFHWDRLTSRLQRIREAPRLAQWLWVALASIWLPLLSFVLVVDRTASDSTPQSAAVPLALLAASSLLILGRLAALAAPDLSPDPVLGMVEHLAGTASIRRLEAAIARLSARQLSNLVPLALITLAAAAWIAPALLNPNRLLGGPDLQGLYYVAETYTSSLIRVGEIPYWNPYLFSGLPHVSHPVTLVFYPVQFVLRLLLPVNLAVAWAVAIHVWVAGIGMYALCRNLRLRRWIALICALAFMLNGEMVGRISLGHVWLVYALAWLPAAWLLLKIALETHSALALVGASLVVALLLLTGHPTFPGYILLFLGLVWLLHAGQVWDHERSFRAVVVSGMRFAVILVLGIGLAGIQVLPSAVLSSQSALSSGYDIANANLGALLPQHLSGMFLPDGFVYQKYSQWELVPYLGVLLPLAAPWAFVQAERRLLATFLGLVAVFALVLAFGHELRLFSALYVAFPPFRVLRIPPRALVLWVPAIIVLGGLGLEALAEKAGQERWLAWSARMIRSGAVLPLGVIVGYLLSLQLPAPILPPQAAITGLMIGLIWGALFLVFLLRAGTPLFARPGRLSEGLSLAALFAMSAILGCALLPAAVQGQQASGALPVRAALFLALSALIWLSALLLRSLHRLGPTALAPLCVGLLVLVDLGALAARHIRVSDPPSFTPAEQQALAVIPPPSDGRVMVGDTGYDNKLMLLGLSNIDGYYSGMLTGYSLYLRGVAANPPFDTVVLLSNTSYPKLDERALDFLNVTHVLSRQPLDDESRELAAEAPGLFFVYRNPDALPRAFWVGKIKLVEGYEQALSTVLDPAFDYETTVVLEEEVPVEAGPAAQADVQLVEYEGSTGSLLVRSRTSQAGVLVMSEPYYVERQVWIDGEPARLLRANVAFSAVAVPAGAHEIQMRYVPTSLYQGAWISLGALAVCVGLALHGLITHRKRSLAPIGISSGAAAMSRLK